MSLSRISTQMVETRQVQDPVATPQKGSTIADHLMQRTAVDTQALLGQNDREWVLNQLGSLHPFPPDY